MKKPPKTATQKIRRTEQCVRALTVIAYILTAACVAVQLLILYSLLRSEQLGTLFAADAEKVRQLLPMWYAAMPLFVFGVVWTGWQLKHDRRRLALIGIGCGIASAVLFILFALALYELLHYNEVYSHGITIWSLIWRHLSPVLPVLLDIAAWIVTGVVHRRRDIADMQRRLSKE